jgi:ABC-type transport system substrate-binding protein
VLPAVRSEPGLASVRKSARSFLISGSSSTVKIRVVGAEGGGLVHKMGNRLAESWKESPDGRMYEFKLRSGLKFHNGNPVTVEDVKFSFAQYRGTGFKEFQTGAHSSGSTLSSSWSAGR